MVDGDTWTGPVKVYQVLQKTASLTDRLSERHYTVLTLEQLLIINNRENLHTFMQLTTTPQMSCDSNQRLHVETNQIIEIFLYSFFRAS